MVVVIFFMCRVGRRCVRLLNVVWISVVWSVSGRFWLCVNSSSVRSGVRLVVGVKVRW